MKTTAEQSTLLSFHHLSTDEFSTKDLLYTVMKITISNLKRHSFYNTENHEFVFNISHLLDLLI
jgi:hypothetical protein